MPRPLRLEFPGAFYHIFSRGNDKRNIFLSDDDRTLFIATLGEACHRFGVSVHSYCLMSNHFHLLIETKEANLSRFMKYFLGVYTLRFNRAHKRVGHLFQGRYRAHWVDKDAYLLHLSRYIHLNPVKAGMVDTPEAYDWSSLKYYLTNNDVPRFLLQELVLSQFSSRQAYLQFVIDGIGQDEPEAVKKPLGGVFIASKDYVDEFRERLIQENCDFRRRECLRIPLDILKESIEFEEPDFHDYVLWKIGRREQTEIARLTSRSQSAVSRAIKRFENRLNKESGLRNKVDGIQVALSYFMD